MDDFILPLGTNGFFPSNNRQTMSFFLCVDDQAILLDAGTGISRFHQNEIKKIIRPFEKLSIILSHYHLDHIVGLSYLSSVDWYDKIDIYGPSAPYVATSPKEVLSRLISPPLSSLSFDEYPFDLNICEINMPNLNIGSVDIAVWPQLHPGGSIGIKLNQDIAYVTDTAIDHSKIDEYSDVNVVLHEVWLTDEEAQNDADLSARHSSVSEVAGIARAANIRCLLPVHHHPFRTHDEISNIAEEIHYLSGITTIVPIESQVYFLSEGNLLVSE